MIGHSLTIFGLERRASGAAELLVFDPMFHDPATIADNVGRKIRHRNPDHALKLYRRGPKYLRKYHEFEILRYVLFSCCRYCVALGFVSVSISMFMSIPRI